MCFCSDEEDTDDSSDKDSSETDEQQDSGGELKCHKLNSVTRLWLLLSRITNTLYY